jgi:hypothetical protein
VPGVTQRCEPASVPFLAAKLQYNGKNITANYDLAVQWIHANAPDLGGKTPGLTKTGR